MKIEQFVELFAAMQFLLIGASHVLQHKAWAEFFTHLSRYGKAGVFIHGLISVSFGSIIVAGHNVWTGPAAVLTVTGWFYMLKSAHSFLIPSIGVKTLNQVKNRSSRVFIAPGVVMVAVGILSAYCGLNLH